MKVFFPETDFVHISELYWLIHSSKNKRPEGLGPQRTFTERGVQKYLM